MPQRRDHYTPKPLPNVYHRMTPRAERILSLFDDRHGYRLLRSTHVIEFLKYYFNEEISEQRTVRCLRWLMDERELLRIRYDPDSKTLAQGSLPKIYGKNTRRNQALNERRTKPSRVVPHELAVADTMAFNVVRPCRESEGRIRFIDAPDILQRSRTRNGKPPAKPFTWETQVTYRGKVIESSVTPDRLFGTMSAATSEAWFYALEEDRTTEPHQRDDFSFESGTSIFRKFLTYVFAYHARVPFELYGIKGFRILFVTDSQTRIDNVLPIWKRANDALKEFQRQSHLPVRPVPNNVLLCIDRPTLRASDIFSVPWVNGRGDRVTIDLPA
jgi:hypothetical protein